MRTEPMSGAQRASLAHEMNADVTERMSAPEQAMADAQKMDPQTMAALGDAEDLAGRRRFARTFIERVAPDQIGEMVDQAGHLSAAGERRIAAALVAKAYGDKDLVEALYDSTENTLRGIGNALRDAAPAWAAMRASIERGETPACFNLNDSLVSAVMLVKGARDAGEGVSKFITMRLIEQDMFTGDSVSQATEAVLRLFYRNEEFTQVRAADKVSGALRDYAAWAMLPEHQGGADIFGNEASADQGVAALRAAYAKDQLGWDERAGVQRAPGESAADRPAGAGGAAEGPGPRFREPGGEGVQPGDGGLHEPGGGRADEGGGGAPGDGGEPERERAGDAAGGAAEPAVPGEPGREPAAGSAAAVANDTDALLPGVTANDEGGRAIVERNRRLPGYDEAKGNADAMTNNELESAYAQQLAEFQDKFGTGREVRGNREALEWSADPARQAIRDARNERIADHDFTPEPRTRPTLAVTNEPAQVNPATAARVIAADPELERLQRDLDAIEHLTGEPVQFEGHDPATIAEAVRAAAVCLKGEL